MVVRVRDQDISGTVGGYSAGEIELSAGRAMPSLEHCSGGKPKEHGIEMRRIGSPQCLGRRLGYLVNNQAGVLPTGVLPDLRKIQLVQLFVRPLDEFMVAAERIVPRDVRDLMLLEKTKDRVWVAAFEELAILLIALGGVVAGAPRERRPAIENAAASQKDLMVHETVT